MINKKTEKKIVTDFLNLVTKKTKEIDKKNQDLLLCEFNLISKIEAKIKYCENELKSEYINTLEKIYYENVINAYKELITK